MIVRGSVPSLIQGISQQTPSLRQPGYLEDGENVYGTLVEGLTRRPGGDYITTFTGLTAPTAHHWIVRDDVNRFKVVAEGGQLKVWDFNGTPRSVSAPDGWSYISGASSLGFVTIKDFTFVYDRGKTVATTSAVEPQENSCATVWCRQGDYNTVYTVSVGYPVSSPTWYSASYTTSATDSGTIKLSTIISNLYSALSLPAGFSKGTNNYSLLINRSDTNDFLVTATDNATGQNIVAVRSTVERTTDLPTIGAVGQHVTVQGDVLSQLDDWYVKFVPTDPNATGLAKGGWQESPKPGTPTTLDPATMPHVLTLNGDGTFTFRNASWGKRVAGDAINDPAPSFIGQQITNMAAVKGRVAIFAGGNFVATRASDDFNFWIKSVQQLTDDDPIDISPSFPKSFVLRGAGEFQAGLILFADDVQFLVNDGGTFGPRTISTKPLSAYTLQTTNGILALQQDRIVCALQRTNNTGLVGFLAPSSSLANMVFDEASAEVPTLMPGSVEWMAGSSTENVVVMKVSGDANRLYAYKETMDAGKIIQSAWTPWRFVNRTPVAGTFIGPDLYLTLKDSNNVFTLEKFSLRPFQQDQLAWQVYLDRRTVPALASFVTSGGSTTVALPWTATLGENVYLVLTGGPQAGAVIKASATGTNSATFPGLFAGPGIVGVGCRSFATQGFLYWRKYIMGGGIESVTNGELQVLRGKVSYGKSGPFYINMIHTDRPTPFAEIVGTPLFGDGGYTSALDLQTGSQEFPIGQMNERVLIQFDSGESPMPMRIGKMEWTGDMNLSARPL
jgi:hypothetical protein